MTLRRLLVFALLAGASLAAQAQATLTLAEQPVRLIRGATLYKGINGSAVQKDDIIETGPAGVQIEAGKNTIVALGPNTRLYVLSLATDDKSATEVALMQGWIKVLSATPKRALVLTRSMQITLPQGATIVQSKAGKDALFAEEGAQQAARIDDKGRAGTPLKLTAEQFVYPDPAKPVLLVGRPTREFLAEMPRHFRDRLVPAPAVPKAGKVAPVKEREVNFEDVDAWLLSSLPVRKNFVNRFKPRLSDPEFRKQLDQAMGHTIEWKFLLRPSVTHGSTIY